MHKKKFDTAVENIEKQLHKYKEDHYKDIESIEDYVKRLTNFVENLKYQKDVDQDNWIHQMVMFKNRQKIFKTAKIMRIVKTKIDEVKVIEEIKKFSEISGVLPELESIDEIEDEEHEENQQQLRRARYTVTEKMPVDISDSKPKLSNENSKTNDPSEIDEVFPDRKIHRNMSMQVTTTNNTASQYFSINKDSIDQDISSYYRSFVNDPYTKIKQINLKNITEKRAEDLTNLIPHLKHLEILDIPAELILTTRLNSQGMHILTPAFKSHINLLELNLSGNLITCIGLQPFVPHLKNMKKLRLLNLSWNDIGPEGAKLLSWAMVDMADMQHLFLERNSIGPIGAEAIASVLLDLFQLQTLNLSWNEIENQGARCLEEGLKRLSFLQKVDLSLNNLDESFRKTLISHTNGKLNISI